jgi:hypothetical protein
MLRSYLAWITLQDCSYRPTFQELRNSTSLAVKSQIVEPIRSPMSTSQILHSLRFAARIPSETAIRDQLLLSKAISQLK